MSEKVIPKASINSDSEKGVDRKGFLSWLSIGWLASFSVSKCTF